MTLSGPVGLRNKIDLNIGLVRLFSQVIVAHQSVKVKRRGRADIGLIVPHLRHSPDVSAQPLRDSRRFFKRRAFRHIDHQLQFALVVERKHLYHDMACVDQHHRSRE